jgi:hypothetical protein
MVCLPPKIAGFAQIRIKRNENLGRAYSQSSNSATTPSSLRPQHNPINETTVESLPFQSSNNLATNNEQMKKTVAVTFSRYLLA